MARLHTRTASPWKPLPTLLNVLPNKPRSQAGCIHRGRIREHLLGCKGTAECSGARPLLLKGKTRGRTETETMSRNRPACGQPGLPSSCDRDRPRQGTGRLALSCPCSPNDGPASQPLSWPRLDPFGESSGVLLGASCQPFTDVETQGSRGPLMDDGPERIMQEEFWHLRRGPRAHSKDNRVHREVVSSIPALMSHLGKRTLGPAAYFSNRYSGPGCAGRGEASWQGR